MKIASWNVNSIKARLDHVKAWLAAQKPDVLMMQELKGMEFPADVFSDLGYESAFVPQKAYNGVAILSRHKIEPVLTSLPGDGVDGQARYLEATINGIRLINIYLPNGNPVETEKFTYKLAWLDRLKARLAALRREEIPVAVGGDFNVIPALLNLGYTDAFRVFNHEPRQYTFWDYQAGSWPANKGIRIDHFLLSPALTDRLVSCTIDAGPRALDKASDHTPIIVELN